MNTRINKILIAILFAAICIAYGFTSANDDVTFLTYTVNPQQQTISMHWKIAVRYMVALTS